MHYLVSENDCYLASKEEQDKLTAVVLAGGKLNRKCVGRDARTLLSMIGVNAPANIRCIVFEGPKEHPLIATELMMPILGVVRAKDFDDAVEQAVWLEHATATLHTFIPRTLTISPNMRKQSTPQSLLRMHLPMQHLDSAEKVTVHSQSQAVLVKDLQVQVHSPREDAA